MNQRRGFAGWDVVCQTLADIAAPPEAAAGGPQTLNDGQRRSLRAIAQRIGHNGVLVADEVGMGKTRIAVMTAKAVAAAGGRVAVLIPPGLGYQWAEEFKHCGVDCQPVLRSLAQYLNGWATEDDEATAAQAQPWASQEVLLISHGFTNWRLGEKAEPWRWNLLPQVYAQWRVVVNGRLPNRYHGHAHLTDQRARRAAADIVQAAQRKDQRDARNLLDELIEGTAWMSSLEASEYAKAGELRHWLERAVGLGLGHFDLVIIDEAHKSRGDESGLTRLLDHVVLGRKHLRHLGMTATPIELAASQWQHTLQRIGVDPAPHVPVIHAYAEAVAQVRALPAQADARTRFKDAAAHFQAALGQFVLRRDKREAESVIRFQQGTGLPAHAYRQHQPIAVAVDSLPAEWARAICAAEALSLMGSQLAGDAAQRLRLSLGNGHGLSAVLDASAAPAGEDDGSPGTKRSAPAPTPAPDPPDLAMAKAQARVDYWMTVLRSAFDTGNDALYQHPGVLAAVQAIEAADAEGEKVLVFGKFTKPMQALVRLLNARAMLRHLDRGLPWAQSTLDADELQAAGFAHAQMGRPGAFNAEALRQQLDAQYQSLQNTRDRLRDGLARRLDAGRAELPPNPRIAAIHQAMLADPQAGRAALAAALHELLGQDAEDRTDRDWAKAFEDLINALCDRDEGDKDGDGTLDADEGLELWHSIAQRLHEEYAAPQGGFARLMNGNTPQSTRRLLQLAFNRPQSFPRVLVAQSMVGREGLNLHRACRTVLLLHPEWNPGVVEQQIGRVDRVGSHWEQLLDRAQDAGAPADAWPRIRVWPMIFEGTYDEYNWQVLMRRWDDLRSQLHGVILPESVRTGDAVFEAWVDEINGLAPRFSPA